MVAKRQRVLVIDDDVSIRNIVKSYLSRMDYDVLEASDARKAKELLSHDPPDLLCLDLVLPDSSGYDLCEFVRQSDSLKNLPILVISARTMPSDRAFAEEVGASAFLSKPFTRAEFTQRVRQMLPPLDAASA